MGCIHLNLFGLMGVEGVHEYILCLWIVFGKSFVRLCFGSVYVVLLGRIVLVISGCVQICWVFCGGIFYLCSSTSHSFDY